MKKYVMLFTEGDCSMSTMIKEMEEKNGHAVRLKRPQPKTISDVALRIWWQKHMLNKRGHKP